MFQVVLKSFNEFIHFGIMSLQSVSVDCNADFRQGSFVKSFRVIQGNFYVFAYNSNGVIVHTRKRCQDVCLVKMHILI